MTVPMPSIRPPALRPSDRVAVVAPAGPVRDREAFARGLARWRRYGWRPVVMPHALERHGYLAGDDDSRAADLQRAFEDPGLRAIVCARGGYGVMRVLDRIDWEPLRADPKPIVGYSDVTALLAAAHAETGVIGLHGPMVAVSRALSMGPDGELLQRQLLTRTGRPPELPDDPDHVPHVLRPGIAEGRLVGGNLSLVCALIGTRWQIDTRGALLFLEDTGEAPYRLDRMLTQLRLAGLLQPAAGVVLGDFHLKNTPPASVQGEVVAVLQDRLADLDIPVAHGFPFGHRPRSWTLPYGGLARLFAEEPRAPARLELLEPAVRAP